MVHSLKKEAIHPPQKIYLERGKPFYLFSSLGIITLIICTKYVWENALLLSSISYIDIVERLPVSSSTGSLPFPKVALGVGGFWDAAILTHPPETETGAQHLHTDKSKKNGKLQKRRSSRWDVAKEIRYSFYHR